MDGVYVGQLSRVIPPTVISSQPALPRRASSILAIGTRSSSSLDREEMPVARHASQRVHAAIGEC